MAIVQAISSQAGGLLAKQARALVFWAYIIKHKSNATLNYSAADATIESK